MFWNYISNLSATVWSPFIKECLFFLIQVHVEFEEGRDKITLEGPPEQVEEARRALEEISRDLQSRLDFAVVKIDPKFHKHIIGKGGANGNDCSTEWDNRDTNIHDLGVANTISSLDYDAIIILNKTR